MVEISEAQEEFWRLQEEWDRYFLRGALERAELEERLAEELGDLRRWEARFNVLHAGEPFLLERPPVA